MAIPSVNELITLTVGMFGAAPGASILTELDNSAKAGQSLTDIANNLASTSVFTSIYPTFLTNAQFSTDFVASLFSETSAAVQLELVELATSILNSGTSRGALIVMAINALAGVPEADATYGASAAALNNKVEVAYDFTVVQKLNGTSLEDLQGVISSVTSSQATVDAALTANYDRANAGQEFTLTTVSDVFNGGAKNDKFYGVYGDDALVGHGATTFGLGDVLDGKGGIDSLSLTVIDTDASAAVVVRNIENINVADSKGTTLDASLFEGGKVNFSLTGGVTSTLNSATALTGVTATGTGSLVVNGPAAATTISKIGTGDLTVNGASTATTFTMGGTGDLLVDYTSTTGTTTAKLAVAGATGDLDVSDGNGIEAVTIATSGTNNVTLTAGTAAATVTVSGSGTNTIDISGPDSVAGLLMLDASTSTATNTFLMGVTLQTTDTIKGGTGADTLSANFTGATLVKPTITGVETIKADFDAAAILNLENATGVTAIALAGGTANATITKVASTVTSLTATTATGTNDISFTYADASAALLTTTLGTKASTAYDDINLVNTSGLILNTTGAGGVTVDDINLNGDQSEITITTNGALTVTNDINVASGDVGAVTATANKDLSTTINIGSGTVGAVSLTVADSADVFLDINADEATGADFTVSVGADSVSGDANLDVTEGDIGNVTLVVGAESSFDVDADTDGGDIGDLTVTVTGTDSKAALDVAATWVSDGKGNYANGGNIGDISLDITGENAQGNVNADADGGNIGNVVMNITGVDASGYVDLTADREGTGGTGGSIGTVTVTAGDDNAFGIDIQAEIAAGLVTATAGDGGSGDIYFGSQAGDAAGVVVTVGDDFELDITVSGFDGDMGDISVTAGENFSGSFDFVSGDGDVGNVSVTATDNANIDFRVTSYSGGDFGVFSVTAGLDANIDFNFSGAGAANIGGIVLTLGDSAGVQFDMSSGGDIGEITINAGDDLGANFDFENHVGDIGDITVEAGTTANITFDFSASAFDEIGDVAFIGGNAGSTAVLEIDADLGNTVTSIGEIDASAWLGSVTIDLSGVQTGTVITVGAGGSTVTGTNEQDNIFLGAGVDTVIFEGTATDTLFGFKAGTGFDVLDVVNAANFTALTTNAGGTLASLDLTKLTDIAGGEDITTEAGLLAALNGGEYASVEATSAGATTYTFVTAATGAANIFYVFNATSVDASTDFATVELVGVVNSSTAFTAVVAGNFI